RGSFQASQKVQLSTGISIGTEKLNQTEIFLNIKNKQLAIFDLPDIQRMTFSGATTYPFAFAS
ncbi:MAG: hypothetical protein WCG42_02570, partial [Parachlamydiaceae bacterium]